MDKKILYATNASAKSRAATAKKLTSLGFAADRSEVMSTSFAAASYLKARNLSKKKVYVIGDEGECEELRDAGFEPFGIGPDQKTDEWDFDKYPFEPDEECGALVVGFDVHFSFPKIIKALTYASMPGNLFIATHADETYPNKGSKIKVPGAGVMVRGIQTGVGRPPDVVLGKPFKSFFDCMLHAHPDLSPEKCLMVGDRLSSDIAFGNNCGMRTLLVLTGASTLNDVEEMRKSSNSDHHNNVPSYIVQSLSQLHKLLTE